MGEAALYPILNGRLQYGLRYEFRSTEENIGVTIPVALNTGWQGARFEFSLFPFWSRRLTNKLTLGSFENAVKRLSEGLLRYQNDVSDTQIRDGLIQRFEFTYEASHRMLKRYLELSSASPEQFDSMPFAELIRSGNEQGLLQGNWIHWRNYREMRAKTSHTYDEETALEVVRNIPAFLDEAVYLLKQLQSRNL